MIRECMSAEHFSGVFFCHLIISNGNQLYHFDKNDIIDIDNDESYNLIKLS